MVESSRRNLGVVIGITTIGLLYLLHLASYSLDSRIRRRLSACVALSTLAFDVSRRALTSSSVKDMFMKAGLSGIDLNKKTTRRDEKTLKLIRPIEGVRIPESQGVVVATSYVLLLSMLIPFMFLGKESIDKTMSIGIAEYLAALLSVGLAAFMGFADDVLDLRWRHKIPLPLLANLPLILVYHASGGLTGVSVPTILRPLLGGLEALELGVLFYVLLLLLAVFSTHAINIFAGVNGLEVGQAVVIAFSVVCLNLVQLVRTSHDAEQWQEYRTNQIQSLVLLIPFLAVSAALWYQNWFPSRVFVGDTYAYFAGATIAAVSIVGHFSKMVILFLVPQALNFLYSLPQLFRIIPIPRHRMPSFDPRTGHVKASCIEFKSCDLTTSGKLCLSLLTSLHLVRVEKKGDNILRVNNLTLINFFLIKFGSCREDVLCSRLLMFQVLCSFIAFGIRFSISGASRSPFVK